MGLAQTQQILAQLYTNSVLRSRFFANPQAVGEELGLNTDEAQQLAKLSAQQVNLFASSLKRKRLGEVRELLPLTQRVLGKSFADLFWRYAETHIPTGIKKHLEDAIAFSTFIEKFALLESIDPPWVLDLLRYEKAWLQAAEPNSKFIVCWFRYAINSLAQSVAQDETPLVLVQSAIAIWFRLSPRSHLRHFVLKL